MQDGKEYTSVEVNEESEWKYSFEGVPIYKSDIEKYEYKIIEEPVENYLTTYSGYNIINEVKFINIQAEKVWKDDDNKYEKRPDSVILQIKNGRKVIAEEKVSNENNWTCNFKLPKYDDDGNEIVYTVDEKDTPKYYEKKIEGNVVINTCTYEPAVKTSDINIWTYIIISLVAIVGVVVGIFLVKKNKKNK